MAGSRIEKFGTIYTRLRGLLRSGAIQEMDAPLWFAVYEAFPPKVEPVLERRKPRHTVEPILYPEDFVRVKFYQTFGNPDVVDLTKASVKTTCQKFVEKYFDLQKEGIDPGELFQETTKAVQTQGIRLRTLEEIQKTQMATKDGSKLLSMSEIYGIDEDEKGDKKL